MKRFATLALLALLVSCSSSDTDEPPYSPRTRPQPMGDNGPFARVRSDAGDGLDMMPPPDWWHEPVLTGQLNLTGDQYAALDKIAHDQLDEIAKLERDSMVAARDFRSSFEANQVTAADILNAGQRLRAIRDSLFDRRLQMLADERAVLTAQQWQMLQSQLQAQRSQRRNEGNVPRRGGRGMGGRGRFPG